MSFKSSKVVIIMIGAPGSGKGTQGDLISAEFAIPKISTGDLVRAEIKTKSQIAQNIKAIVSSGNFVDDDTILLLLKNRIAQNDCDKGFILDGYPRNDAQASMLLNLPQLTGASIKIFYLKIDTDNLIKRLEARFACNKCGENYNYIFKRPQKDNICDKCGSSDFITRDDDQSAVIKERMNLYKQETEPLIEFYAKKEGILPIEVDASSDVKSIFAYIKKNLTE